MNRDTLIDSVRYDKGAQLMLVTPAGLEATKAAVSLMQATAGANERKYAEQHPRMAPVWLILGKFEPPTPQNSLSDEAVDANAWHAHTFISLKWPLEQGLYLYFRLFEHQQQPCWGRWFYFDDHIAQLMS